MSHPQRDHHGGRLMKCYNLPSPRVPVGRLGAMTALCAVMVAVTGCQLGNPDDSIVVDDSVLSAQEELCLDYPESLTCPTLPELPLKPALESGVEFAFWSPKVCPPGYSAEFGIDNCISIGDECPDGIWPDNLPGTNVKYVTPGGTGDGSSKENAAGSIQQMLSTSTSGTTIALSKGVFEETFVIEKSQTVVGACAKETQILHTNQSGSNEQVIGITGAGGSVLRNLKIGGAGAGVFVIDVAEAVELRGVWVQNASGVGMLFDQGSVVIGEDIVIESTIPLQGQGGWGIEARSGANISIQRTTLLRNQSVGILLNGEDTTLVSNTLVVADTQVDASGDYGMGIQVNNGATWEGSEAYFSGNHKVGITVQEQGSLATLRDVVVRNTKTIQNGSWGRGLSIERGAKAQGHKVMVSNNHEYGLYVGNPGTEADLQDVTVIGTNPSGPDYFADGVKLQAGAKVRLERVSIESNAGIGLSAGEDTEVVLIDARLGNNYAPEDVISGIGLFTLDGAQLELSRVDVFENLFVGIAVRGANTDVRATDLVVRGTIPGVAGILGWGVLVDTGASLDVKRGNLTSNREKGLMVSGADTRVVLDEVLVNDTQSSRVGLLGRGVQVQDRAAIVAQSLQVVGNRETGIMVMDQDTYFEAKDLIVKETKEAFCATTEQLQCPYIGGFGDGMVVLGGASVSLEDFSITENARTGMYLVAADGTGFANSNTGPVLGTPQFDGKEGEIINNQYGVTMKGVELDSDGIEVEGLACFDNESTVDGCTSQVDLTIPSPSKEIEGLIGKEIDD